MRYDELKLQKHYVGYVRMHTNMLHCMTWEVKMDYPLKWSETATGGVL